MIAVLEGIIRSAEADHVVCMAGGVGYRVYLVGTSADVGAQALFHIYDHIREDRRELYGFSDRESLLLFERLIDVSGIGTKLAQKMLSQATRADVEKHIMKGDLGFFEGISGVGKKTAQKIILELQGSLVTEVDDPSDKDAIEALMSLGYQRRDAVEALKGLEGSTEDRIKQALKRFGSNS